MSTVKKLKATDVEFLVGVATQANEALAGVQALDTDAGERLKKALGKTPDLAILEEARDMFVSAYVLSFEIRDAEQGASHWQDKKVLVKNGVKTTRAKTDQQGIRKKQAVARWTRFCERAGFPKTTNRVEGEEKRGRPKKMHKCPHCAGSVSFTKGIIEIWTAPNRDEP